MGSHAAIKVHNRTYLRFGEENLWNRPVYLGLVNIQTSLILPLLYESVRNLFAAGYGIVLFASDRAWEDTRLSLADYQGAGA
jgi:hypothetical protein